MEGLFKSLALQHMPANMQNIDRKKSGKLHVFKSPWFIWVMENQKSYGILNFFLQAQKVMESVKYIHQFFCE